MWVQDRYRSIKYRHEQDTQVRKEWARQVKERVWFPPKQDQELERIFNEFKIAFESEIRDKSVMSVPVLNICYGDSVSEKTPSIITTD